MSSAAVMIQKNRKTSWRSKNKGSLCIYLTKPENAETRGRRNPKMESNKAMPKVGKL